MGNENQFIDDLTAQLDQIGRDARVSPQDRQVLDHLKRCLRRYLKQSQKPIFLDCPRCGTDLQLATLSDLPANRCSGCGGLWLDSGVLPEFAENRKGCSKSEATSRMSLRSVWPEGFRYSDGRVSGDLTSGP